MRYKCLAQTLCGVLGRDAYAMVAYPSGEVWTQRRGPEALAELLELSRLTTVSVSGGPEAWARFRDGEFVEYGARWPAAEVNYAAAGLAADAYLRAEPVDWPMAEAAQRQMAGCVVRYGMQDELLENLHGQFNFLTSLETVAHRLRNIVA